MARNRNRQQQDPWISEAASNALIRYGPEIDALTALQRQAEMNRNTGIRQARGTARGITQAVQEVRPDVARVYNRAGLNQARNTDTLIHEDLANLGGVANSIKAGAALEQTTGLRHLREQKADALGELGERQVQAQQGRQWGEQNARQQFVQDMSEVLARRQGIARESGAYMASLVGQRHAEDRERRAQFALEAMQQAGLNRRTAITQRAQNQRSSIAQTQQERSSLRSSGIDPDTMQPIAGGRLDPDANGRPGDQTPKPGEKGTPRLLTPARHAETAEYIESIASRAQALKQQGLTRDQVRGKLRKGRAAVSQPDPDHPEIRISAPSIAPVPADLRMQAALDMVFDGHLWRQTTDKLRQRGYHVVDLNLTPFEVWEKQQKKRGGRNRRSSPPDAWTSLGSVLGALGG